MTSSNVSAVRPKNYGSLVVSRAERHGAGATFSFVLTKSVVTSQESHGVYFEEVYSFG